MLGVICPASQHAPGAVGPAAGFRDLAVSPGRAAAAEDRHLGPGAVRYLRAVVRGDSSWPWCGGQPGRSHAQARLKFKSEHEEWETWHPFNQPLGLPVPVRARLGALGGVRLAQSGWPHLAAEAPLSEAPCLGTPFGARGRPGETGVLSRLMLYTLASPNA